MATKNKKPAGGNKKPTVLPAETKLIYTYLVSYAIGGTNTINSDYLNLDIQLKTKNDVAKLSNVLSQKYENKPVYILGIYPLEN